MLGSPIAHSLSPAIHRAAYEVLSLDWSFEAVDVTGTQLRGFIESLDSNWRGVSLTMPLKRDILELLTHRDPLVDVVGAANTVLLSESEVRGFNTDVRGVIQSFADVGVSSLDHVHVLGAGATAASVLVAVAQLGATRVLVSARTPANAVVLVELGERLGVDVVVRAWGIMDRSMIVPDAVVSTVPGGSHDLQFTEPVRTGAVLFDVAYDPWPSDLARSWSDVGGTVISGLDLLINQAVGQVRVFVSGDPGVPLENEAAVVIAMRSAVA